MPHLNKSAAKEFAELVRDARKFLEQNMRIQGAKEKASLPPVKTATSAAAPPPPVEETPPPAMPQAPPPKPSAAPAASPPKGSWELQAMTMTAPSDTSALRQKLAPYTSTNDPALDVLLILPEENSLHRLFLENVSRAVTRSFASASVTLYHEGLLQEMRGKLILAPLSLLHKRFPKALPHIPVQEGGMTWIPLENLDIYTHDVTAKRALWMSIQRSFQS
ncbi:hypothetical protein ACFLR2_00330 [Chlamydiota bacterium]